MQNFHVHSRNSYMIYRKSQICEHAHVCVRKILRM